jgi:hypothetical protein
VETFFENNLPDKFSRLKKNKPELVQVATLPKTN